MCIRVRACAPHLHARGTPTSGAHGGTRSDNMYTANIQYYNTHVGRGRDPGRTLTARGLAGWPAACSPGRQPLPICKTRVSFPSPSFLTLSFLFPPYIRSPPRLFRHPRLSVSFFSSLLPSPSSLPTNGRGAENRRAKYRATFGRNQHLQIHEGNGSAAFSRIRKRETAFTG